MGLFPTCSLNHKKTSTGASLRLELNITLLTRTKSVQNIATIIPCIKKVQCSLSSGWAMHGVENRSFQNYVLLQQKQAVFQNLVSCLARQHFWASYGHWTFACQFHKYCHFSGFETQTKCSSSEIGFQHDYFVTSVRVKCVVLSEFEMHNKWINTFTKNTTIKVEQKLAYWKQRKETFKLHVVLVHFS